MLSLDDGAKFNGPGLTAVYRTVAITAGALTITLTDAIISSYQVSGGTNGQDATVEIAFNAPKREFK